MIFLAQTDTTAGLLSKDFRELNSIKGRQMHKPCLMTTSKFSVLKDLVRVPVKFKNRVRRSRKTTFLYPNLKAVRVVKGHSHSKFLDIHGWFYSTSANLSGQGFDEIWARSVADVVVDEKFYESESSKIYKLSKSNLKKLR